MSELDELKAEHASIFKEYDVLILGPDLQRFRYHPQYIRDVPGEQLHWLPAGNQAGTSCQLHSFNGLDIDNIMGIFDADEGPEVHATQLEAGYNALVLEDHGTGSLVLRFMQLPRSTE